MKMLNSSYQDTGGLCALPIRSEGMPVRVGNELIREEFLANIESLWRATPQEAVTQLKQWHWRVCAERIKSGDLPSLASADKFGREITYYEFSLEPITGGFQRQTNIDAKTHYHELWHAFDATSRLLDNERFSLAYQSDHARLTTSQINAWSYYLAHDRKDERFPKFLYDDKAAWGLERSMEETKAELAAEHIADGGGPLSRLMPETAIAVAADIKRAMPCLAYRPQVSSQRFLREQKL